MTPLRAWFDGRSLREKRMILVMLALLAVTIVWGGIIRPIGDALADARQRHADAVLLLGQTRARVAAVRDLTRGGGGVIRAPLADELRARAEAAGFVLASLDIDNPGQVRTTIQSARPAALFAWIARLERGGILVDDLQTTDNGDRTLAVRLTLRARAR